MNAPRADSRIFRAAREEEWRRLDTLLARAEAKSPRALSDEDLIQLPTLYRGALSSLSVARESSLDLELITYLEALCARAYFFVYGVRTSAWQRLALFFAHDWPNAVRGMWRETIVSTALMLLGAIVAYLLVSSDAAWFGAFIDDSMAQGRDFSANAEELRSTLYDQGQAEWLGIFATFLFTHNSQVAIMCFALGFAFGVPTSFLLVMNGATVGAFLALFNRHDLGGELGGWLFIHGTTELFAIVLAGAAGLKIGWAVVFPGSGSRLSSATEAGRSASIVMSGVVLMLLVAGLLEGVGRQIVNTDVVRYAIGGTFLALWFLYYYFPRRPPNG